MYLWMLLFDLPLATVALLTLGVLLHYTRNADRSGPAPEPGRSDGHPYSGARRQTRATRAAGGMIALALLAVEILQVMVVAFPLRLPYVLPLATSVLAIVVCMIGTTRGAARGVRRGRRLQALSGWQVASGVAVAAILVITVVGAGALASDDDMGRSTQLTIRIGTTTAGTEFLGWFFGVPMPIALLRLAVVVVTALRRIAGDSEERADAADLWLRRLGTRSILALATAGTLFTLGQAWASIAASSTLTTGFRGPDGHVSVGTSIAALGGPLSVLAVACQGVGLTLALVPLFAAVPQQRALPTRTPTPLGIREVS